MILTNCLPDGLTATATSTATSTTILQLPLPLQLSPQLLSLVTTVLPTSLLSLCAHNQFFPKNFLHRPDVNLQKQHQIKMKWQLKNEMKLIPMTFLAGCEAVEWRAVVGSCYWN